MKNILNNGALASWVQALIYLITLAVLYRQLRALTRQTQQQSESIRLQTEAMQQAEYMRCQIDFTETMRSLIQSAKHDAVYDDLAANAGSQFQAWQTYSSQQKATYAYLELIYELFERVYCIKGDGWIDEKEWKHWERWIDDVIGHLMFADVHKDNLGMYDSGFEAYIEGKLQQRTVGGIPSVSA
jgi:hypothetical protein